MGHFEDEVARATRAAGFGVGVPAGWEETKAAFLAEREAADAAAREALVARIREAMLADLVVQFDGGGWLKVDAGYSNWIELDGTVDIQQLAAAIADALTEREGE